MSDYAITPEAINYRPTLLINPFHPSITKVIEEEEEKYKVKFNQGYIFDYLGYLNAPYKIENMSTAFDIGNDEEKNFCVDIFFDTGNGGVLSGNFRDNGPAGTTYPLFIQTTDNIPQTEEVQTINVCKMKGPSIEEMYLRDNIHWWGRAIKQNERLNSNVAHPIAEPNDLANQPLIIKSISGNGQDSYKIVDVFDEGNNNIVVSGVTGFGVMYGDGPEGFETYKFLPYPSEIAESAGGYSDSWEWRLVATNDPPSAPAWAERQYLPQVAEGAGQGDILYYDETQEQWVILDAPTPEEMTAFGTDPFLHHDGLVPYWDTGVVSAPFDGVTTGLYVCVDGTPTLIDFYIQP